MADQVTAAPATSSAASLGGGLGEGVVPAFGFRDVVRGLGLHGDLHL